MSHYIPEARLEEARQIVARGWTEPATCRIVMDPVIAEAIARHVAPCGCRAGAGPLSSPSFRLIQ